MTDIRYLEIEGVPDEPQLYELAEHAIDVFHDPSKPRPDVEGFKAGFDTVLHGRRWVQYRRRELLVLGKNGLWEVGNYVPPRSLARHEHKDYWAFLLRAQALRVARNPRP